MDKYELGIALYLRGLSAKEAVDGAVALAEEWKRRESAPSENPARDEDWYPTPPSSEGDAVGYAEQVIAYFKSNPTKYLVWPKENVTSEQARALKEADRRGQLEFNSLNESWIVQPKEAKEWK